MTKAFPNFPKAFLTKDKIAILMKRFENKYFLDVELDDIDPSLDRLVKPNVKITKDILDREVNRDQRAKHKKVYWVLHNDAEYCDDFKFNLETEVYSSVKAVIDAASLLYSEYCPEYQKSKATVSSENGFRVHKKRKTEYLPNEINKEWYNEEENEQNSLDQFKAKVIEEIGRNYEKLRDVFKLTNEQLRKLNNEPKDSNKFVRNCQGYSTPAKPNDRHLHQFLATIYDIVQNIN